MQHYFYNFKTASIIGEFINPKAESEYQTDCKKLIYSSCKNSNKDGRPICKDLLLGNTNNKCYNNDVRSHSDRSKFIIKELINVYPGIKYRSNRMLDKYDTNSANYIPFEDNLSDTVKTYNFNESPDELITNITYGQFVAFWLWKGRNKISTWDAPGIYFESRSISAKDLNLIIKSKYIPTEKEFGEIQSGIEIKKPSINLKLPTPTFRYCISFYPNN